MDRRTRKPTRLRNYDYGYAGYYFITFVTIGRKCVLSEIKNNAVHLTKIGECVRDVIVETPDIRDNVQIDSYVIMPNHVHMIVQITGISTRFAIISNDGDRRGVSRYAQNLNNELKTKSGIGNGEIDHKNDLAAMGVSRYAPTEKRNFKSPTNTIGALVRSIKSVSLAKIRNDVGFFDLLWQRNYNDHIIRNPDELARIRKYINDNPRAWPRDRNNDKTGLVINRPS